MKELKTALKKIDISEWKTLKKNEEQIIDEKTIIKYKLDDNIYIKKIQDLSFNNSFTYVLCVNDKDIFYNTGGYTIKYLKELGTLYKKYNSDKLHKIIYTDYINIKIIIIVYEK